MRVAGNPGTCVGPCGLYHDMQQLCGDSPADEARERCQAPGTV